MTDQHGSVSSLGVAAIVTGVIAVGLSAFLLLAAPYLDLAVPFVVLSFLFAGAAVVVGFVGWQWTTYDREGGAAWPYLASVALGICSVAMVFALFFLAASTG